MDQYDAIAFSDSLPKGRASGVLRLQGSALQFDGASETMQMPMRGLKVELGGASNRLLFVSHPQVPEWRLSTRDRRLLHELGVRGEMDLVEQVKRIRSKRWFQHGVVWGVVTTLLLLPVLLWAFRAPLVNAAVNALPVAAEKKIGSVVFAQLTGAERVLDSVKIQKAVDQLTAPLLTAMTDTPYTFKIVVVADSVPNAFALPGGFVVIHSGLIVQADTAEEVLGVLGHEIAHVTQRHGLKNMVNAVGLVLVVQTLFGDVSSLVAIAAEKGSFLLQQQYSRDAEREADTLGVRYLADAGIDPEGLINFLTKVKALQDDREAGPYEKGMAWLQTHPAPSERIASLKALRSQLQVEFTPVRFDMDHFQTLITQQRTTKGDYER